MKRRPRHTNVRTAATALAMLALFALAAIPARADGGYAALLIIFGDDDYYSECVPVFDGMTSLDLLGDSSVEAKIESVDDAADSVCSIDDTGCDYPDDDCFCQCDADECYYWAQYYWEDDAWQTAFDPEAREVWSGDLEAWVWGEGLNEPPIVGYGDICAGVVLPDDSAEEEDAYPGPATAEPYNDPAYPDAATFTPRPTATAAATSTPRQSTPTPSPTPQTGPAGGARSTNTPIRVYPTLTKGVEGAASKASATPDADQSQMPNGELGPTPNEQAPGAAISEPAGSPTADQVAMLINTSAARVRATTLATSDKEQAKSGGGGTTLLIVIGLALVIYGLILQRQHHLAQTSHEAERQTPDSAPEDDKGDEQPPL